MKTILVLVGEKQSANGICADAIMKEFYTKGYKVVCITNQEHSSKTTENNTEIMINRIKPRLSYRLRTWSNQNSGIIAKIVSKLSFVLNKFKLILSIPTSQLISPSYIFRFYKGAKELYEGERFDCIISIYTQIDTVIAGYFISKKYPEVKFVPYFLDSLSGGYGPKVFSKDWVLKRGLKWEKILLKRADKIIVMKSSQKHHEKYSRFQEHYSKMRFLDIPLLTLDNLELVNNSTSILDQNKINLVYLGSIPYNIRNPKYMLEIFKRLNIKNCTLTIIGTNTCPDIIRKAQEESTKNKINVISSIPHEEAKVVLKNADILINIGNNISSMVPSKIFEYMSFGKPIISTFPIDDEPSIPYLKNYPLSLLLKEDWNQLDEDVLKVENFIKSCKGEKVDFNKLKRLMHNNTPQAFVEEIELLFDYVR